MPDPEQRFSLLDYSGWSVARFLLCAIPLALLVMLGMFACLVDHLVEHAISKLADFVEYGRLRK